MATSGDVRKTSVQVWILYAVAGVLAVASFAVPIWGSEDHLAAGLLQSATLFFTVWASVLLGKEAFASTSGKSIPPQARSAFRRVKNLYAALGRQRDAIDAEMARLDGLRDASQPDLVDFEHARMGLITLKYLVVEQINTADDAMTDWREIVPDEVALIDEEVERQEDEDEA